MLSQNYPQNQASQDNAAQGVSRCPFASLMNTYREKVAVKENVVKDITQHPFKRIVSTYREKGALNRSKGARQNRLFYSMSPVGHRFLENIDSTDPQFQDISSLARQLSKALEENANSGFEKRLQSYWKQHPPAYPVCSLRNSAFGAVLNEIWFAFFAQPCPQPKLMTEVAHNILMVVKDWTLTDLTSRQKALDLIADAVQQGLNPQLQIEHPFPQMHEVIFALTVSAVDELSEGFAHTLLCLVQNPEPLPSDHQEFVMATYEALRLYPLFTMSTRPSRDGKSLFSLDYVRYHRRQDVFGDDADRFNWQRWGAKDLFGKTFIFGIGGNRACPARGSATKLIPMMVQVWMQQYKTRSYIHHCRNLPCGGLAIVTPVENEVYAPLFWVLSWLHFGAWLQTRVTFWLGIKWWVKYQNLAASKHLAEADRYYEKLSAPSVEYAEIAG